MIAAEGLPVEVACRVLATSTAGYYAWLSRPPSAKAVRHALLTDVIAAVHATSKGIYGARRVHAELTLGRGLVVGKGQVEMLMHRAGLKGVAGRPTLIGVDSHQAGHDREGPREARLRQERPEPAVGHRHHRAPHP